MSEDLKRKLIYISIALVAIFIVFILPNSYSWGGDGAINVFPESNSVKNYRLESTMEVTRHSNGWIHGNDEYSISRANWPNGGYLEFNDCKVNQGSRAICISQDGTEYGVEVDSYPDRPEVDTSN